MLALSAPNWRTKAAREAALAAPATAKILNVSVCPKLPLSTNLSPAGVLAAPSIKSRPSPTFHTIVSSPMPPLMASFPVPPKTTSLPSPALIVSTPPKPRMISLTAPAAPFSVLPRLVPCTSVRSTPSENLKASMLIKVSTSVTELVTWTLPPARSNDLTLTEPEKTPVSIPRPPSREFDRRFPASVSAWLLPIRFSILLSVSVPAPPVFCAATIANDTVTPDVAPA